MKANLSLFKRRIMYSYGRPESFNPAVIASKEAHMTDGKMNNETWSSQAAARKHGGKCLPRHPVC